MRVQDLLLENVFLVEEEDDGGMLEPGVGDDSFEESFRLLHAILWQKNQHLSQVKII